MILYIQDKEKNKKGEKKMRKVSYKAGTLQCERALFIDDIKPFWFRVYFGWRRTFIINDIEIMEFIFTNKDIAIIEKMK